MVGKNSRIPSNEEVLGAIQIIVDALGDEERQGLAYPALRAAMALLDVRWRGSGARLCRYWRERLRERGVKVDKDGRLEVVSGWRFSHAVSIAGQTECCPTNLLVKRLEDGSEPYEEIGEEDWPKRGKHRYCKSGVIEKEVRPKRTMGEKMKGFLR